MPQLIFSPAALRDLKRLRDYLRPRSPVAARRAAEVISKSLKSLVERPHVGRPADDMPQEYREWPIDFGDSGYLSLYRIDGAVVVVLAIKHQRASDY